VGWTSIYQLFWCSPGVQGFDPSPYLESLLLLMDTSWRMVVNHSFPQIAYGSTESTESTKTRNNPRILYIWLCLKPGYTPNYSHLVGIMIINHWV
jgi:hypothetical protein